MVSIATVVSFSIFILLIIMHNGDKTFDSFFAELVNFLKYEFYMLLFTFIILEIVVACEVITRLFLVVIAICILFVFVEQIKLWLR